MMSITAAPAKRTRAEASAGSLRSAGVLLPVSVESTRLTEV
ncbi:MULTISPECIES: hypothetical protein [Streptomyces]|nr:hypothetical protein [Streptomyces venezuelae]